MTDATQTPTEPITHTARTLAEALLALDDPDMPVKMQTEWDSSGCGCCYEPSLGMAPITSLTIENGAITFEEGDPEYCEMPNCRYGAYHDGPDGLRICYTCFWKIQDAEEEAATQRIKAEAKAAAIEEEARWKGEWRKALTS